MMKLFSSWLFLLCTLLLAPSFTYSQLMKCSYGERGSLTSTCTNASAAYFKSTNYRFDNLDETVQCINCSLEVIAANTFDISGNQILNLNLTRSGIKTLRESSFVGLIFLKNLFLENNEISNIYPGTFRGIKKLEFLNFENNSMKVLITDSFKELINLTILNFKNNSIVVIEPNTFRGLDSLKELNLEANEINKVEQFLDVLPAVVSVNLRNNKITTIWAKDMNIKTLVELNLAENLITILHEDAFLSLPQLEKLDLSGNGITEIKLGTFRGLNSLEYLDLSNNKILEIPLRIFQGFQEIRAINLAYNNLTVVKSGSFTGLPQLRSLNFSHNAVREVMRTGVLFLNSLNTLDISFNKIVDIDYKAIIHHIPRLSHLAHNNNPLPCYLAKEIDDYFKEDNIKLTGDNVTNNSDEGCVNVTRKIAEKQPIIYENEEATSSSSHSYASSYIVYTFLFLVFGLIGSLFYLQFRADRLIKFNMGQRFRSEANLIASSDLQSRDDY